MSRKLKICCKATTRARQVILHTFCTSSISARLAAFVFRDVINENVLSALQFPELSIIRLQDELNRPCTGALSAKASIIRQVSSDQLALLWESYFEHGIYGVLDHISGAQEQPLRTFSLPARLALQSYHFGGQVFAFLRGIVFPQLQVTQAAHIGCSE